MRPPARRSTFDRMSVSLHPSRRDTVRVVIVGAGVAGLETALALHATAAGLVAVEILTPEPEFAYRPLAVAEPFGLARVKTFEVDRIAAEAGATVRAATLRAIDADRRTALTTAG